MLDRIGYVIVYVRSVPVVAGFFKEKIGLKPSYESGDWAEFPLQGATLAFHASEDAKPRNTGIVFTVDDIHTVAKELAGRGVEVSEPRDIGVGLEAWFADPEGNKYSLFQPYS